MAKITVETPPTNRFTILKVSPAVFQEIEVRLRLTTDEHPFHLMDTDQGQMLDLAGYLLAPDESIDETSPPLTDLKSLLAKTK